MIVEMRTYTIAVGQTARYFKLYAEKGLPLQKRILGHLVGYYSVEIGALNQVVHLWGYESLDDRARRRAELWTNEDWLAYIRESAGLVTTQDNQILNPAPFFQVPPSAA